MHPQNLHTLRACLTKVRHSISWWKWVCMLSKDSFLDELEQCALPKQQFSLVDLSPLCCAYRYPHTVVTILGIFVCTSFLNVWPGYKMTAIIQTEGWSSISRNQAGIKGAVKEENMWNTTNFPSKIHEKDYQMGGKACCFPPNNSFKNNFLSLCMLSCFSHVWLFATLWTVARQAPLSMQFSRQEYWSGLPFPSSGDLLPNPGTEPMTLMSPASTGRFSLAPPETVDIFTVKFNDKSPWWPRETANGTLCTIYSVIFWTEQESAVLTLIEQGQLRARCCSKPCVWINLKIRWRN